MRAALVVNTGSRTGAEAFPVVCEAFAAHGYPLLRAEAVEDPATIPAKVADLIVAGTEVLILAGGDGTVSGVAGLLAEAGLVLGLVPTGTANDLARTLGIPTDLAAACATVVTGVQREIDLGMVGGRAYLNVASVGLSVGVTEALTPELKRLAGNLAYPLAAARAYLTHERFTARLEFPSGDHEPVDLEDLLQVTVGNGRYYGGGNLVAPGAGIDDHLLDVYAVPRGTPLQRLAVARDFSSGAFTEQDHVLHVTTPAVRLTTEPPLPVNVDGELVASTPQTFTVAGRALRVLVPGGRS